MIKIKDTEHYYIDECGNVFNTKFSAIRELKIYYATKGYATVSIQYNGKSINRLVHRLVAEAYLPNPLNLPYVCHKDDNPHNPHKDNLYWGTHQDNMNDRSNRNRTAKWPNVGGPNYGAANGSSKPLIINNIRYETIRQASKSLGISGRIIRKYANNKVPGYQWA